MRYLDYDGTSEMLDDYKDLLEECFDYGKIEVVDMNDYEFTNYLIYMSILEQLDDDSYDFIF